VKFPLYARVSVYKLVSTWTPWRRLWKWPYLLEPNRSKGRGML